MPLPEPLTRQVGPFSVAGWLAIIGGGLGAGYLVRRHLGGGGLELPALTPAASESVAGGGATVGLPNGAAVGVPLPTGPQSNEEWVKQGVAWLHGQTNPVDAILADTALRKYVDGHTLTTNESKLVSMVLAQFGTPPEGASPAEIIPPPPTSKPGADRPEWKHPVRPVGNKRLTGDGHATPKAVSRFVYGSNAWWILIRDANPQLHLGPDTKIPVGTTFIVP